MLHTVWCGWSFDEVVALFEQYQPGHYASRSDKEAYLRVCWQKALGWITHTPAREIIARLWAWAEARPWPGRGGGNEFLTYRALLQRAWLADTLTPDMARRDVQLEASLGWRGASSALKRLAAQGLVIPENTREHATDARTWRLVTDVANDDGDGAQPARAIDDLPGGNELWATLGRAAGMVYVRLTAEPQTATELAAQTGKHRTTVWRALQTLEHYGLAIENAGGWSVGPRDIADVANELDAEAVKKQRERTIQAERETFRELLARKS